MARDADGRAQVHLQNVASRARRRRSGLFTKTRRADGLPIGNVPQQGVVSVETRGRRSVSQRKRDLSEQLRSFGAIFEGSPKLVETIASAGLIGLTAYLLRPHIVIVTTDEGRTGVRWGAKEVDRIRILYPDREVARILGILVAVLAVRGQDDMGGLLAPAASAGFFSQFIVYLFPDEEVYTAYDLRVLTYPGAPKRVPFNDTPRSGVFDARPDFYLKAVLPRLLYALLVAFFFWFILRYSHSVG